MFFFFFFKTNLVDWTDNQWATAFSEQAEIILNMSSQQLGELKDSDETAFSEKVGEAAFSSYIFKIQVRMDNYNVNKIFLLP